MRLFREQFLLKNEVTMRPKKNDCVYSNLIKHLCFCVATLGTFFSYCQITEEDERQFTGFMEKYDIPGVSIAVVENYEIVYAKAFGVRSSKSKEKLLRSTPLQAASISKTLTAALFLRYAQKSLIDLDTSIDSYLEGWKLEPFESSEPNTPTARQLLSHTGGINMSGYAGYYSTDKSIPSLEMILNNRGSAHFWESKVVTKFEPGNQFSYSGGGYCILQQAIEDLSDQAFEDLMFQEVFIPCEMRSSFINVDLTSEQQSTISHGHNKRGKPIKSNYHIYPQSAAAGLWTTPTDLAKFLIQLMKSDSGDRSSNFLSTSSFNEMIEKQKLKSGRRSGYGLGFGLESDDDGKVRIINHSGSQWGFACKMYANVQTGQAIIIMINRHKMALWPFTDIIMDRINFRESD